MTRKALLLISVVFFGFYSEAQTTKGKVIDFETKKPLYEDFCLAMDKLFRDLLSEKNYKCQGTFCSNFIITQIYFLQF